MPMGFTATPFRMTCFKNSVSTIKTNMKKSIFLFLCILSMQFNSFAQTRLNMDTSAKMQWFKDAKLGIFIHWGIYSVNGVDES